MNRNQQHICVTCNGCDSSSGECKNSDNKGVVVVTGEKRTQTKQHLATIQAKLTLRLLVVLSKNDSKSLQAC